MDSNLVKYKLELFNSLDMLLSLIYLYTMIML